MKFNKVLKNLSTYEAGKPIELVVREYGIDPKEVVKLAQMKIHMEQVQKLLQKLRVLQKICIYIQMILCLN